MSVIHQRIVDANLLQGSHVAKLEILDLDHLEQVEALLEDGGPSLPELLADKQRSNLRLTALDQYLAFERGIRLRRPNWVDDMAKAVIRRILTDAGLEPSS